MHPVKDGRGHMTAIPAMWFYIFLLTSLYAVWSEGTQKCFPQNPVNQGIMNPRN